MSCGFFSEKKSIFCQRITNENYLPKNYKCQKKGYLCADTRVVKTNNRFSVFSFCNKKKTNKRFDRISKTVGDERSKF